MLLAAPGVGKTTLALNWAARSGARTLYCSADTDDELMFEQLASLATGHDREQIAGRLDEGRWHSRYADAVKRRFPNLVLDFDPPNLDVVGEKVEALTEVWGDTPQLVVLDTATDVERVNDDPSSWIKNWIEGRTLARFFNTTVMWCHHVKSGPAASGRIAPSQADGLYNADRFSEIVLGLHTPGPDEMTVTVLKNRGGRKDIAFQLAADLAHARLDERPSTGESIGTSQVLPWL